MSNKVVWDVFVVAADADEQTVAPFVDQIRLQTAVFWPARDISPGQNRSQTIEKALKQSGAFLVMCTTNSGHDLLEQVARAVEFHKTDLNRVVIPVVFPQASTPDLPYGTRVLQGVIINPELGFEPAAEKLLLEVKRRRAVWQRKARVAIVCCFAELRSDSQNIRNHVAGLTGVDADGVAEYDATDPGILNTVTEADIVVALVGIRTGGTDVLQTLARADRRALLLGPKNPDSDTHFEEDEAPAALVIRKNADFTKYPTVLEAGKTAADAIARWLRDFAITDPGLSPVPVEWERVYLTNRVRFWHEGAVGPLHNYGGTRKANRADYYVPLRAKATPFCWALDDESVTVDRKAKAPSTEHRLPAEKETRDPYLERVVSHPDLPYLVLEGDAGSGKSVLVQHIAAALAAQHGIVPEGVSAREETLLDLGQLRQQAPLPPIPILVEARQIAEKLPADGTGYLVDVLRDHLAQVTDRYVDRLSFAAGLNRGRYVILVDSLDEVTYADQRLRVVNSLACFAKDDTKTARVVLTTRPMAHTAVSAVPDGFVRLELAAVDTESAEKIIRRWGLVRNLGQDATQKTWEAVLEVRDRHEIENLIENPLLLVCTALVYEKEGTLPDSTCDLYYRMVDTLCALKIKDGESATARRELLQEVMFALQNANTTALPVRTVCENLVAGRPKESWEDQEKKLDQLSDQTNLLRFVDEEQTLDGAKKIVRMVRPWHRSFQEYLAAKTLAAQPDSVDDIVDKLFGASAAGDPVAGAGWRSEWTGVVRFLAGAWGSDKKVQAYVRKLFEFVGRSEAETAAAERPGRLLGIAAGAIAEYGRYFPGDHELRTQVRDSIVERFEQSGHTWPLEDRLLALDQLGRLGDPRLERPRWIPLPGGVFVMGRDQNAYWAAPLHRVKLDGFSISWRLETVADYLAFIEAGGYKNRDFWADFPAQFGKYNEPADWHLQKRWQNRPVTGVSWYEAMAYCRWLGKELGCSVRLPTEAEWEYAATVGHSGILPWGGTAEKDAGVGNEARANYLWSHSGESDRVAPPVRPTPVGAFPRGNHALGTADLAGNVWEWCRDAWREPNDESWPRRRSEQELSTRGGPIDPLCHDVDNPCHQGDNSAPRAVRGGSWLIDPWGLRCACRDWLDPWYRDLLLGFRVVLCVSVQHG